MVPGERAFYRRRLLQRRLLYRRYDCSTAGGLGYRYAQLADGLYHLRRTELCLGNGVAGVL